MIIDRQSNMHDLSWFIDMESQGRLELNPPYQRKSVWTASDRYYFLDTVFNNYPCPAVYLQKDITTKGPKYNVVDGKQRLSTILNFHKNKIRLPKNFNITRLAGKRFNDLDEQDVINFYNYIFLVETLKSSEEADWSEIFYRVNKNQKQLTDQELRHARFDGWFINRAEDEVDNDKPDNIWVMLKISTHAKSKRMKDVEFVSILMLVTLENNFVGFPQSDIDKLYAKYDFDITQLSTEDDLSREETEISISDTNDEDFVSQERIYKEDIEEFEKKFSHAKKYILSMENFNNCITKHKRRITTDLYSLWTVLNLSDITKNIKPEKLAVIFDNFVSGVDGLYELAKKGDFIPDTDPSILLYYNNSIGAGTTIEHREIRHFAFIDYISAHS